MGSFAYKSGLLVIELSFASVFSLCVIRFLNVNLFSFLQPRVSYDFLFFNLKVVIYD